MSTEKFPPRAWIDSSDWAPGHSGTDHDGCAIAYANPRKAKGQYKPIQYLSLAEHESLLKSSRFEGSGDGGRGVSAADWKMIARDVLLSMCAAGQITPAEGYVKAPFLLPGDVRSLARSHEVWKQRAGMLEAERDRASSRGVPVEVVDLLKEAAIALTGMGYPHRCTHAKLIAKLDAAIADAEGK